MLEVDAHIPPKKALLNGKMVFCCIPREEPDLAASIIIKPLQFSCPEVEFN